MKKFIDLSDEDILNCICGQGMTVMLIREIIVESESLVKENYVDTELFSKVFIRYLNKVIPDDVKSNGDWACGYITADNLNELMNPDITYED